MEFKDRRVDFFGTKYWIRFMDKIPDGAIPGVEDANYVDGCSNHSGRYIWIALRDCNGNKLDKEEVKLTVYHELVHAILATGQFNEECQNEPLVEWFARNIKGLIKQKVL